MNILKSKVIICIKFENTKCVSEFFNHFYSFLLRILFHKIFCIVIRHIENLFTHKFLHTFLMKSLESIL